MERGVGGGVIPYQEIIFHLCFCSRTHRPITDGRPSPKREVFRRNSNTYTKAGVGGSGGEGLFEIGLGICFCTRGGGGLVLSCLVLSRPLSVSLAGD